MQLKHQRTLEAAQRVQAFLDTEAASLGDIVSADMRARFDKAVQQMAAFQVESGGTAAAAVGATAAIEKIKQKLYDRFMRPITQITKAFLADSPDMTKLVVPVAALRGRDGDFLTDADNQLEAAQRNEVALRAGGMGPTHLAQFKDALTKVAAQLRSRNEHLGRRSASVGGLNQMDREIRVILVTLDPMIRADLKDNEPLLARWAVARRIAKTASTPLPTGNDDSESPDSSTTSRTPTATTPPAAPALTVTDGKAAA